MPAMSTAKKLMVVGLDCVPPEIVFDDMRDELPVLSGLMERGAWGRLESCDPPITVPAWSCMMSSKDPGTLGFYGFRNRKDHSYDGLAFATSDKVRVDRLWDMLGREGKHVVALGVPQTFPPRPVNGEMVSCFLTPSTDSKFTYPEELKDEVRRVVGDYMVDVPDYRTDEKDRILRDINEMTRRRFALARHLRDTRPWDFLMLVEMGPGPPAPRVLALLRPRPPRLRAGQPVRGGVPRLLPLPRRRGGRADRGPRRHDRAPRRLGSRRAGHARRDPGERVADAGGLPEPCRPADDADAVRQASRSTGRNTRVWADGGYYSRIFMNVKGREPEGVIDPADYEPLRDELIAKLEALGDEDGNSIGTRVFRPTDLYREVNGVAPDLICYFGNLAWRSIGSVGDGRVQVRENDTGPDDANHAKYGIAIMLGPGMPDTLPDDAHLFDIAPTLLTALGMDVPAEMRGRPLQRVPV